MVFVTLSISSFFEIPSGRVLLQTAKIMLFKYSIEYSNPSLAVVKKIEVEWLGVRSDPKQIPTDYGSNPLQGIFFVSPSISLRF